ncbi:FAD-binding oxidoreductase [Nocardioides sp. BP30]|uniref:FAD-binding oxidoreductase n=1 Tax=Nocardioides sp. BP30 TaxID=3036374 RepID=UPI002468F6F3|nr:FAD-binding oxidoreductase [Nocardioides sp. BP30]WGL50559.1 FAD-binding oxidoreductase [Nocardioides sp. BP30]
MPDSSQTPFLTRRALATGTFAAALGALAGCTTDHGARSGASASAGSSVPTGPQSGASPTGAGWEQLRRNVSGSLALSGTSAYGQARLVENPAYDAARPLAVLRVAGADDVATALRFAADHAVPLAIRSGGHSYPGWSAGGGAVTGTPRALVLDCRSLDQVAVDGATATVGAGAALAVVYDTLGARGRAVPAGSCATVGVAGLTQGGGVGVLTRALGLTCDAVRAMEVVTPEGRVRTVDADHDPDLFWALRGGGGGQVGVVTRFTFATQPAPRLATFYLTWSLHDAAAVVDAWQRWAPGADSRLWSTLKSLAGSAHPDGPVLSLSGTWTGPPASLPAQLAGLLRDTPPPSSRSTALREYRAAMAGYAGCAQIPVARCHTGPGGALTREAFAATSHVAYRTLPSAGITALLDRVQDAQDSGLHEAGASLDALGGRVRDLDPADTAFVHRQALMTVQYTATYHDPDRADAARAYVRGLRTALTPWWGQGAYVNYADTAVQDYRRAYFGANAERLATVKSTYDPHRMFTQPQSW